MRIRTFFKYIIIILICSFIFNLGLSFLQSSAFDVTKINVKGDYTLVKKNIVINLKKILIGKNIWNIPTQNIDKKINADIRIKNFKITKTIPNVINITINSKIPYAYVKFIGKKNIYVENRDGVIFSTQNKKNALQMYTFYVNNIVELENINTIILHYLPLALSQKVIKVKSINSNIFIYFKNKFYFKTNIDVGKNKYFVGYRLYKKLSSIGKNIKYIDLRYNNYAVKEGKR